MENTNIPQVFDSDGFDSHDRTIKTIIPMFNIYLVDISGKVIIYDEALFEAFSKEAPNVHLLYPGHGLLSLVPKKYKDKELLVKRLVKVIEGLLNYLYVLLMIATKQPSVLHLQWLPFMEVCGWEIPILKMIRKMSSRTKIVLTIHNVYPHNMSASGKIAYNGRFQKACNLIDEFIVHTEISKQDVIREFSLSTERVHVCCHGVFVPAGVNPKASNREGGKLHILQFGGQSFYKGTDILVDAVCGLDKNFQAEVDLRIVGGVSDRYLSELKAKDKDNIISWKTYFLADDELYEEINKSDIVVLPYRAISQSGVLLLSIFFEKLIICSDLPSFKETMQGGEGDRLDDALFFASESHCSLRNLITRYINKEIDEDAVHERIIRLKGLYSWESAAKATLDVYQKTQQPRR